MYVCLESEHVDQACASVASATGVCDKSTPFTQALARQPSIRNCSPAPDLAFCEPIFPRVPFSGGVFFADTGIMSR